MPLSALNEIEGRAAFQHLVHRWCTIIKPHSGYAGLGAIQSIEMMHKIKTSRLVYPLVKRFPGLDVDNPPIIALHIGDNIKGVNWLTALSDACMARLGGREAFLAKLDHNYHVFDYEDGVLIQAGATPQLGDINRKQIPYHYRELSQLVKPIRMAFPEDELLFQPCNGQDDTEVSNEWLARFDT